MIFLPSIETALSFHDVVAYDRGITIANYNWSLPGNKHVVLTSSPVMPRFFLIQDGSCCLATSHTNIRGLIKFSGTYRLYAVDQ